MALQRVMGVYNTNPTETLLKDLVILLYDIRTSYKQSDMAIPWTDRYKTGKDVCTKSMAHNVNVIYFYTP